MSKFINRRKFLAHTALSAAGVVISGSVLGAASKNETGFSEAGFDVPEASYNLMKEVAKFRKIDAHVHPNLGSDDMQVQRKFADILIDYCDRLNVEKLVLSKPVTRLINGVPDAKVESYIINNNIILDLMKRHPKRFTGSFTINPIDQKAALKEVQRCVDQGMVGAKIYYQNKINDPLYYPIIEKMIDLKIVIFSHAEAQLGVGGYRMKYDGKKPANTSIPEDFVDIAKRYPEGTFQFAHIGGGGDWEYMCKTLKNSPNVYVDTSGSNNEEHMIDFAVQHLGEDRLFFGSDNCYYQAVGKILASNLTDTQKKKIFFENYNNILRKAGNNVN